MTIKATLGLLLAAVVAGAFAVAGSAGRPGAESSM